MDRIKCNKSYRTSKNLVVWLAGTFSQPKIIITCWHIFLFLIETFKFQISLFSIIKLYIYIYIFISQHIYKGKIIIYNNQNLIPSLSLWLLPLPLAKEGTNKIIWESCWEIAIGDCWSFLLIMTLYPAKVSSLGLP